VLRCAPSAPDDFLRGKLGRDLSDSLEQLPGFSQIDEQGTVVTDYSL
jgi:hypothetical protein